MTGFFSMDSTRWPRAYIAVLQLALLVWSSLFAEPSLVFIHLGNKLPDYLPQAITQARAFNHCSIYLIANQSACKDLPKELESSRTICIPAESLKRERNHETFRNISRLDRLSRNGFWLFATERFFYLYELMKTYALSDVFHLEYDNMLYADVSTFLPTLHKYYSGKIAATFDNDSRCIGGFMYISDAYPLRRFLEFVVEKARTQNNDMEFLAQFKGIEGGTYIDHLPIIPPSYAKDHPLVSPYRHTVQDPTLYSHHFNEFQAVFDAAALGQYLGGIDPRNGPSVFGFINESCIFNPSHFEYEWREDFAGRLIPMIIYRNEQWPIINLHVHSKNLRMFDSRRNKS